MQILVAGGLGYIGSHTVVELINEGYEVAIIDDLSNSNIEILKSIETITTKSPIFYEVDLKKYDKVKEIFKSHNFTAIIHFASAKSIGESVERPLFYYENNLMTTINLCRLAQEFSVKKIIFSSSATVYGENKVPFKEDMELLPTTNPYGETKVICERILKDFAKINKDISISILRYFNPVGSEDSGMLQERPKGVPSNLMPYITEVACGRQDKLFIYGDDYDTKDGTGIRDYIHILDLAKGHIFALENAKEGIQIYNLGTGEGYSVLDIVKTFEKVHNVVIPYEVIGRREGDIAVCYADCNKAKKELGFYTKYNLEDMCKASYKK
ncbi:MAG: UDP-glucose 4-epimerase GalE [Lachnospirales bacterium]